MESLQQHSNIDAITTNQRDNAQLSHAGIASEPTSTTSSSTIHPSSTNPSRLKHSASSNPSYSKSERRKKIPYGSRNTLRKRSHSKSAKDNNNNNIDDQQDDLQDEGEEDSTFLLLSFEERKTRSLNISSNILMKILSRRLFPHSGFTYQCKCNKYTTNVPNSYNISNTTTGDFDLNIFNSKERSTANKDKYDPTNNTYSRNNNSNNNNNDNNSHHSTSSDSNNPIRNHTATTNNILHLEYVSSIDIIRYILVGNQITRDININRDRDNNTFMKPSDQLGLSSEILFFWSTYVGLIVNKRLKPVKLLELYVQ